MTSRTRPMSVAAPTSILIAELQHGGADPHAVARLHHGRRGEALVVHERAVRRAEVLDVPRAVLREEAGVLLRDERVVERQLALGRSAHHHVAAHRHRARLRALGVDHDGRRPGRHGGLGGGAALLRGAAATNGAPSRRSGPRTAQRIERQMNSSSSANSPYFRADSANGVTLWASSARRHGTSAPRRNTSTVVPIVMRSPSSSAAVCTAWPLTSVPFVEPRSVSVATPSFRRIWAWRLDAPRSARATSH